ncbi:MAG: hypothetical protein NZM31_01450, partial [Gemmatales bacterium]|nr:hypothetical protein [Gemmatales bacterium]MDW8385662.1 hypothetical protein [Gemmatales bacterium]
ADPPRLRALIWERSLMRLRPRFPLTSLFWGLLPAAVVVAGYYWWLHQETNGEFTRVFFWYHNLARGLGQAEELEHHPWWFYFVRIGPDLFPWSLLIPVAITKGGWETWKQSTLARFSLAWFAGMFACLTCMSFKRADYLLPAYPGAALFLSCILLRWSESQRPGMYRTAWLVGPVAAAVAVGWLIFVNAVLPQEEPRRELRTFADAVRQLALPTEPVLLFRIEGHQLVYHLGRPVERVIEWENLDIWLAGTQRRFVIMTPTEAAAWPKHLEAARLYPLLDNSLPSGEEHEQPLVLLSNLP